MKSYRKELWFNAPTRMHFTNITSDIRDCLAESGIKEGLVLLMRCTSQLAFLLTMMNQAYIMTIKNG